MTDYVERVVRATTANTPPAIKPSSQPYMTKTEQAAVLRVVGTLIESLPVATRERLLWEAQQTSRTNLSPSRSIVWALDATRMAVENERWFT